jgi:hypothetical protein
MTENSNSIHDNDEVKSTSVSITLNGKPLGVDCFIKLEETREFVTPISTVDVLVKREELAALLTEQALAIVSDTAKTVKEHLAANPVGHVSVHSVTPPSAPAGSQVGVTVPAGAGAPAVVAVANGATAGGDWRNAVDRFDANKTVRYLATSAYSTDQMRYAAAQWLTNQGFNAQLFDVWDERSDAEQGKPISSVCNIKVNKDQAYLVPSEVVKTPNGGNKAVARAKFNGDGSLYFYWSKEAEAAVKYGAFNPLKNQQTQDGPF